MHAVRLHHYGPAENLSYEEIPDPEPGPGQVRIAVAAAGVHLLDTALREGLTGPAPAPVPLPTTPGREVAGTVDALGEGTDPALLGRRVVAHLGFAPGGYAELAVTGAERLHAVPGNLDAAQAVAMIGTGRTALGIAQFTELGPGSTAVVLAAAGGIGTLLVQYAKNAGAVVVGLAGGPDKCARVRANGADLAVDYREPGWPDKVRAWLGGRPVTDVFDGVGGTAARDAVALLDVTGDSTGDGTGNGTRDSTADTGNGRPRAARHLVYGRSAEGLGTGGGAHLVDGVSVQVLGPAMLRRAGGPDPLRTLERRALAEAASGHLVPALTRFPLAAAADAHRALESRATTGKVVLEP